MSENKNIYTPTPESKEKQEQDISNTIKIVIESPSLMTEPVKFEKRERDNTRISYLYACEDKLTPAKDVYRTDAYLYTMYLEAMKDNKFCDVDPIMVQYATEDLHHTEILSDDFSKSETEDNNSFDANPRIEWLSFSSDHTRVIQRRIYKFPNNYGADVVERENTDDTDFRWELDIIVWDGDQYYPCVDSYIPDTCHCMLNVHKVNNLLGIIRRLPKYDG